MAVFVVKGKEFPFTDKNDLIGKKGVTNQGESYGNEFDAFMKDKLDVARAAGIDAAFKDLLDGKADYLIAGYYPGLAEAAKQGIKDKVVPLRPGAPLAGDVRRLFQEIALPVLGGQVRASRSP